VSFDYSVLSIVLMGRAQRINLFASPTAKDREAARSALTRVGLSDYIDRPFRELSGGLRQLAIFARALVSEADILVLDEPTSALDLKNQSLILNWIARLSREEGLTVVFTTHHPHHALAVADEVLLMTGEQSYICGAADVILSEEHLHSLYGVPLKRLSFQHSGHVIETLAPVFQINAKSGIPPLQRSDSVTPPTK
jgi:iron complex transport system ATP-binding protein